MKKTMHSRWLFLQICLFYFVGYQTDLFAQFGKNKFLGADQNYPNHTDSQTVRPLSSNKPVSLPENQANDFLVFDDSDRVEPLTEYPHTEYFQSSAMVRDGWMRCCSTIPNWYARAEAVVFDRDTGDRVDFSIDSANNTVVIDTDILSFGGQTGPGITIGRDFGNGTQLECTYYGLQHWSSQIVENRPNQTLQSFFTNTMPGPTFPFNAFNNAVQHRLGYASELHNVEATWRKTPNWNTPFAATCLLGMRYIRISDDIEFFSVADPIVNSPVGKYNIDADNNGVGPQIGAEFTIPFEYRLIVSFYAKTAFLFNTMAQHSAIANAGSLVQSGNSQDTGFSSLYDLGFNVSWRFGDRFDVYAGYEMIYVSGLALGAEQADFFANPNSQHGLNSGGDVFFHGPRAGFVFRWGGSGKRLAWVDANE